MFFRVVFVLAHGEAEKRGEKGKESGQCKENSKAVNRFQRKGFEQPLAEKGTDRLGDKAACAVESDCLGPPSGGYDADRADAVQLGIEALKRIETARMGGVLEYIHLLPGETKD